MMDYIFKRFHKTSDPKWCEVLIRSLDQRYVEGINFPGFPTKEIQENLTGRYGERSLRQAYEFYRKVKFYAKISGIDINENTTVCDFACGWGRIIRFFLKDTLPDNITGIDCINEFIEICEKTIPFANFIKTPVMPPYRIKEGSFDIVFAFSLFSHLSESIALSILNELKTILKKNGVLVLTSRGKVFMKYCQYLRNLDDNKLNSYHKQLSQCFIDYDSDIQKYLEGEFLFYQCGGGGLFDEKIYGEAAIPKEWFIGKLCSDFDFIKYDYEDLELDLDQTIISFKKK